MAKRLNQDQFKEAIRLAMAKAEAEGLNKPTVEHMRTARKAATLNPLRKTSLRSYEDWIQEHGTEGVWPGGWSGSQAPLGETYEELQARQRRDYYQYNQDRD